MRRGPPEVEVDRDLVEQARRGIVRRSPSWCTRSAISSTRSRSGSCATRSRRGRTAERPRARLAPDPAPAGTRPIRGVDPSDPRQRLLRRVAAGTPWTATVRVLPVDGPSTPGRQRRHRRPRRTGAGIPPAPGRPAGGVRPAPLPRAAARGDRRDPRDPRGHGPIATCTTPPAGSATPLSPKPKPAVQGGRLA